VHDGSDLIPEAADVAHQDGTVADYRDAAEKVLDGLLCGQGDS